ncbi:MAG: hypothetical protein ACOC6U_02630 [Thermoplasmatota archaeon]
MAYLIDTDWAVDYLKGVQDYILSSSLPLRMLTKKYLFFNKLKICI